MVIGHFLEGAGAASEVGVSLEAGQTPAFREGSRIEMDLKHIPVFGGAGEGRGALGSGEEHVQDDLIVCGIGAVAVVFPIADVGIEFDGALEALALAFDGGVEEIGQADSRGVSVRDLSGLLRVRCTVCASQC